MVKVINISTPVRLIIKKNNEIILDCHMDKINGGFDSDGIKACRIYCDGGHPDCIKTIELEV